MTSSTKPSSTIHASPMPTGAPPTGAPPTSRRHRASWVAVVALLALLLTALPPVITAADAADAPDSRGRDFWLAFPLNHQGTPELSLFITGETDTSGTVAVPGLGFSVPYTVTAGDITTVALPASAQIAGSDVVSDLGIHVTAADEVTVYGLNRIPFTTDAYLGLPTDILGTDHVVLTYGNVNVVNGTQFAVVGTQDGTTVTITPSVTTGARTAGQPYTISLDRGQTYQLRNTSSFGDLTGTTVTSDAPIAVFGSHQCANIPAGNVACDHLVQQLPPTETWGERFVTYPLATRLNGDTFRILAATDGTVVSIDGTEVATLDRGQHHEQLIVGASQITSTQPVLVAQFSNSTSFDNVLGDPFMMLVPPFEQFLGSYTVTTPASGFAENFVSVVAPDAAVGSVTLDGVPIPAEDYAPIGTSGFSGVAVPVGLGSYNLNGPLPFGVFVYGFNQADSYGYPGGLSLAAVASVADVALAPKTATRDVGTEHCVTATVTDQEGDPLNGVRVDFEVTGTHPSAGFAVADGLGEAGYCYTGTVAGSDSIVASVGSLADSAEVTWQDEAPDNEPPLVDAGGDVSGDEGSPIALDGSATDPEDDPLTIAWTYELVVADPGTTCAFADASSPTTTITCNDDGVVTVTLTADDGVNPPVSDSATVTIANVAPAVTITSPADLSRFQVGATVDVSASFTDPGSNDTHTCSIDWGDGTSTDGTIVGSVCTGSHVYGEVGAPTIRVTVTDDDGASGSDSIGVVVADEEAKVTGGGFITDGGRTSFGFVAKDAGDGGYQGQIQVRLPGKDRFHGSTVESLQVSGNTATWSGDGRWNGRDGYRYEVTVTENRRGGPPRGANADTFAITIRDAEGATVHHVQGPLRGGKIKIHS
jgi:hypothetical protein